MMKHVYVTNNIVIGMVVIHDGVSVASGPSGSTEYVLPDSSPVQVGWTCVVTNGAPVFSAPTAAYVSNIVSIGIFLSSITSQEYTALEAHPDPLVQAFVKLCNDPRVDAIDLNLPRIQFDVKYAAGVVAAPAGASNAGQLISNPPIGGATRAAAILAGNALASTN